MSDHINIQDPERRGVESQVYRDMLEIQTLKVELRQLRQWYDALANDLSAIFNRIERGDPAELHYRDGRIFVITGKERE